jgi:hypothetical protein
MSNLQENPIENFKNTTCFHVQNLEQSYQIYVNGRKLTELRTHFFHIKHQTRLGIHANHIMKFLRFGKILLFII